MGLITSIEFQALSIANQQAYLSEHSDENGRPEFANSIFDDPSSKASANEYEIPEGDKTLKLKGIYEGCKGNSLQVNNVPEDFTPMWDLALTDHHLDDDSYKTSVEQWMLASGDDKILTFDEMEDYFNDPARGAGYTYQVPEKFNSMREAGLAVDLGSVQDRIKAGEKEIDFEELFVKVDGSDGKSGGEDEFVYLKEDVYNAYADTTGDGVDRFFDIVDESYNVDGKTLSELAKTDRPLYDRINDQLNQSWFGSNDLDKSRSTEETPSYFSLTKEERENKATIKFPKTFEIDGMTVTLNADALNQLVKRTKVV